MGTLFSVVYFSSGTLPQKRVKGSLLGDLVCLLSGNCFVALKGHHSYFLGSPKNDTPTWTMPTSSGFDAWSGCPRLFPAQSLPSKCRPGMLWLPSIACSPRGIECSPEWIACWSSGIVWSPSEIPRSPSGIPRSPSGSVSGTCLIAASGRSRRGWIPQAMSAAKSRSSGL